MPVLHDTKTIIISHPIAGLGPQPAQLGPMSLELALWLKYRLEEFLAHSTYDHLEAAQLANFFQSPDVHEWNVRCILAGTRGYKTKLCAETGKLSEYGLTIAKTATEIIDQTERELFKSDPTGVAPKNFKNWRTWKSADELFISANFSVRQARMLKLMLDAITEAERLNKQHLVYDWTKISTNDEIAGNGTEPLPVSQKPQTDEDDQNGETRLLPPVSELTDILSYKSHHIENQPFEAITLMSDIGRRGFVPTAIFGQKARNDMKMLTKYGLVDIKAYAHGQRGRPKHVVRPSVIGDRLVADLVRRGII